MQRTEDRSSAAGVSSDAVVAVPFASSSMPATRFMPASSRRAIAAALLVALSSTAPGALAYSEIQWSWIARQQGLAAPVAQGSDTVTEAPGGPPIVLNVPPARVPGSGPLSTTLDFNLYGKAIQATRTLGSAVSVSAQESAWDPRITPPQTRKTGEARMVSTITDFVEVRSPLAMLAAGFNTNFITMSVRKSPLEGLLQVPEYSQPGAGFAFSDVTLNFQLFETTPTSAPALRYEIGFSKRLDTTGGPSSFRLAPGGPDPLGGRTFPLQNGRNFLIVMSLSTDVLVSGDPFPENGPINRTANSDFQSTFTFGGFFDFRDEQGNLLDDVTFTSQAGIDWLAPIPDSTTVVPLPGSLALLAGGLPLLVALARGAQARRRRAG